MTEVAAALPQRRFGKSMNGSNAFAAFWEHKLDALATEVARGNSPKHLRRPKAAQIPF